MKVYSTVLEITSKLPPKTQSFYNFCSKSFRGRKITASLVKMHRWPLIAGPVISELLTSDNKYIRCNKRRKIPSYDILLLS